MRKYLGYITLLCTIWFASCAVDEYDINYSLNTPLGLTVQLSNNISDLITNGVTNQDAVTNNNYIFIRFWAYNNETYFSGYSVFIAESLDDLTNTNSWSSSSYRQIPDQSDISNAQTLTWSPMSGEPQRLSLLFSKDTNYASFVHNTEYFIHIKAYSQQFGSYSLPSNPTNIVYSTN